MQHDSSVMRLPALLITNLGQSKLFLAAHR
jgi:hypothetical protein